LKKRLAFSEERFIVKSREKNEPGKQDQSRERLSENEGIKRANQINQIESIIIYGSFWFALLTLLYKETKSWTG
jgi:hypothetical protein